MQPWLKKMLTTCGVPADGAKHVRRKIGGRFCLGAVFLSFLLCCWISHYGGVAYPNTLWLVYVYRYFAGIR